MVKDERQYVLQSTAKALELLRLFTTSGPELGLTELSRRLNLSPTSVLRLVVTLQAYGFLEQNPDNRKYRIGLTCLELGSLYLNRSDMRQHALPVLRALRDDCRETVHLARLAGTEVVYLEKLEGLLPIGLRGSTVGGRAPAHCTALGQAMLAQLPDETVRQLYAETSLVTRTPNTLATLTALLQDLAHTRERGSALDDEESDLGAMCVGVPLFDYTGHAVGAISCSGPVDRMRDAIADRGLAARVAAAARAISARLAAQSSRTG